MLPISFGKYTLPVTQFLIGAIPIAYISMKKGGVSNTDKLAAMIGIGAMGYAGANTLAVMAGGVGAGPIFNMNNVLGPAKVAAPRTVQPKREMLLPVTGGGY